MKGKGTEKRGGVTPFKKDAGYYLQKSNNCTQQGERDKALMYLEKALEASPGDLPLYYQAAYLLTEICAEEGNRPLEKLQNKPIPGMSFLLGVYFCMKADLDKACLHLKAYLCQGDEKDLLAEARKIKNNMEDAILYQRNLDYVKLSYKYAGITESVRQTLQKKFESPFVRVKMKESLYQVDDDLTANVIFLYSLLDRDERAERVLRHFAKSPWAKEKHIELALLALKKIGAPGPYEVMDEGTIKSFTLQGYMDHRHSLNNYGQDWKEVLAYALENMKKCGKYPEKAFYEVKSLWVRYIHALYPEVPDIDHKIAWAAALEYTYLKLKNYNISSKHMALIYNVSHGQLVDKHEMLKKHCRL